MFGFMREFREAVGFSVWWLIGGFAAVWCVSAFAIIGAAALFGADAGQPVPPPPECWSPPAFALD